MSDIVRLNNSLQAALRENQELQQRVADLSLVVKNVVPIMNVFYNSVANTSNVTAMFGYLEAGLGMVDAPLEELPATLQ